MKRKWAFTVALAFVAGLAGYSLGNPEEGNEPDWDSIYSSGFNMSPQDADAAELILREKPDDAATHVKLASYYSSNRFTSTSYIESYVKHVQWIIRNTPQMTYASVLYVFPDIDGSDNHRATLDLWIAAAKSHENDPCILVNAGKSLMLFDNEMAESLIKKAVALQPKEPQWRKDLGDFHSLGIKSAETKDARASSGDKAFDEYSVAYDLTAEREKRFYLLGDLAWTAYYSSKSDKAALYAKLLLSEAKTYQENWNYGNAIHDGNTILGLLKLDEGKTNEACKFLLLAGKTPGSPQLDSFGTKKELATRLLEKGKRTEVIEYLRLCSKFWKNDITRKWIRAIKAGMTPDLTVTHTYEEKK